jgi:hypothetical protein
MWRAQEARHSYERLLTEKSVGLAAHELAHSGGT